MCPFPFLPSAVVAWLAVLETQQQLPSACLASAVSRDPLLLCLELPVAKVLFNGAALPFSQSVIILECMSTTDAGKLSNILHKACGVDAMSVS